MYAVFDNKVASLWVAAVLAALLKKCCPFLVISVEFVFRYLRTAISPANGNITSKALSAGTVSMNISILWDPTITYPSVPGRPLARQ